MPRARIAPPGNWGTALSLSLLMLVLAAPMAQAQDADGDGWTVADGDCYDSPSGLVLRPELVNPGAYDAPGNGIDDDCDGIIDNPAPTNCSTFSVLGGVTALDLAYALDLCQSTTDTPPLNQKTWGILSASLVRASGSLAPNAVQAAVKTRFGTHVTPVANATMAVLSSGTARDAGDPGFISPYPGFVDGSNVVSAPPDFIATNGGLYHSPGCPQPGNTVYDSARLRLVVRVPTNASGFQFSHRFFSAEYPNTCSQYNDHVMCRVISSYPGLPADKNVLFDSQSNHMTVQTAFFENCASPCPSGGADLAGTGYSSLAGGTNWSTSSVPVVPGETIILNFTIWDSGDGQADALALFDDFRWILIPQGPTTEVAGGMAPGDMILRANPNPSTGPVRVEFGLPSPGRITLEVFDVSGRRVRKLADGEFEAGLRAVTWDGRDDEGRAVESGTYFARLRAGDRTTVRRLARGR